MANSLAQCVILLALGILFQKITISSSAKKPYSHVCNENELYKPYVYVFDGGRHGPRVDIQFYDDSQFYVIGGHRNIYVCINGPAYLYFSNTTKLGVTYDSQEMHVFDHICEMYNVEPAPGATTKTSTKTLNAIQLMGDRNNYYINSALQLFTAPYYDKDKNLYVNATSLIIYGDDVCFIHKDNTPIIIRPKTATAPLPGERRYCKLGYQKNIITPIPTATGADQDLLKDIQSILRTDVGIRNLGCGAAGWADAAQLLEKTLEKIRKSHKKLKDEYARLDPKLVTKMTAVTKAITDYDTKITNANAANLAATGATPAKPQPFPQTVIDKWTNEKAKKQKELDALTELRKIYDDADAKLKDAAFTTDVILTAATTTDAFLQSITAFQKKIKDDVQTKEKLAFESLQLSMTYKQTLEKEPWNFNTLQPLIEAAIRESTTQKGVVTTNKASLDTDWSTIEQKLKAALELTAEIDVLLKATGKIPLADLQKNTFNPTATPPDTPLGDAFIAKQKIPKPYIIDMDKIPSYDENDDCQLLHPVAESCEKGKPDAEMSCNVFKSSLGYESPKWAVAPVPSDQWKGDILDTIESIFSSACFRLPRRFTKTVHKIFKMYLTDNEHYFNAPDPCTPTATVTCPPPPSPDANKAERPFWVSIREALAECDKNKQKNLLFFKNMNYAGAATDWRFLKRKDDGDHEIVEIFFFEEQADKEFYFNWVIDWQYKIFATVLGLCMPSYEPKNPLITSKFYAMYTEDFVIPLRKTWINSKDNQVFNWILGEFKHGDAEPWLMRCMEASFIQAGKLEYRPLRSVLINGGVEHNVYTNGILKGYPGPFPKPPLPSGR